VGHHSAVASRVWRALWGPQATLQRAWQRRWRRTQHETVGRSLGMLLRPKLLITARDHARMKLAISRDRVFVEPSRLFGYAGQDVIVTMSHNYSHFVAYTPPSEFGMSVSCQKDLSVDIAATGINAMVARTSRTLGV
jgi:hypothetical protein